MAQVLDALCRQARQHIHFPGREQIPQTKQDFYNMANFPNAIDCTHIPFIPPSHNEHVFRNRKHTHIPLMHRLWAIQNKSLQMLLQSTLVHVTTALFSEVAQSKER